MGEKTWQKHRSASFWLSTILHDSHQGYETACRLPQPGKLLGLMHATHKRAICGFKCSHIVTLWLQLQLGLSQQKEFTNCLCKHTFCTCTRSLPLHLPFTLPPPYLFNQFLSMKIDQYLHSLMACTHKEPN